MIHRGELADRLDAIYYRVIKTKLLAGRTIYPVKKLGHVTLLNRGRFSHRPRNDPSFYGGEYPFIQTGDVVSASEKHGGINYTQTLNEKGVKTSRLFQPDRILITIAANIGDTAILRYPACFPDSVVSIVPKDKEYLALDYLNYYLKFVRAYLVALAPQSAQKNINLQQLSPTPIVIPPMAVQVEIVAKMDAAYATKKRKEAEARRLLDSIDAYLLGELGIVLPKQEDETVEKRVFIRRRREVSNGRFDPNSYRIERLNAITSIKNGTYIPKPLYQIVSFRSDKIDTIDEETTYIGLENIVSHTGELIPTESKDSISSAAIFRNDDVLFPKLRPYLNKVFYSNLEGLCSTEFHVLHSDSENNEYLANFLRSKIVIAQTKHLMSGNTLPRLQFNDIKKLLIPIPSLDKQEEIVSHIAVIRNRAKQLQKEAKTELAQAKQAVEALILGG